MFISMLSESKAHDLPQKADNFQFDTYFDATPMALKMQPLILAQQKVQIPRHDIFIQTSWTKIKEYRNIVVSANF